LVGPVPVNDHRSPLAVIGAFIAGVALGSSLAWVLGDDGVRASEPRPDESARVDKLVRADIPTSVACPPPPACPPASAEATVARIDPEPEPEEPEHAEADVTALVQAALSEAMAAVNVSASFDLDCTARPCLAVFVGEIPSMDERADVIQRLVDTQPGIQLSSSTIFDENSKLSWVVGLADSKLTREEEALVRLRIEDLLP
jgi:hypothetical protein